MLQSQPVSVRSLDEGADIGDWLRVPRIVYGTDPNWIEPLNFVEKQRISRKHAPFFTFGDAAFFVAYRGRRPVGRISAQINRLHLRTHKDNTGHFGFFDCVNDVEASGELVGAAANWLRQHGVAHMAGPFSLSINEECGCLVEGFDSPPAMLMPHGARWTGGLLENAGMVKEIDLFAFRTQPRQLPPRIEQLASRALQFAVSLRHFDMRRYRAEIDLLVEIYNDAWSDSWGFVPFTTPEIDAMARELRPFFRNEYGRFLLVDGKEIGFAVALPDLNGVIAPFHGRLLPFNWARLLWTMRRESWHSARIPFLGIRREWRTKPRASALVVLLVRDLVLQASSSYNLDWAEYSWVRENDARMMSLGEAIAGPPVKAYRIFKRPL